MALILLWSTTDCSTALWRWRLRKVAQLAGATDRRPPTAFTATNCPAPFRSSQQLSSPQLRNSAVVAEPARELIVCAASALRAPVRRERSRVPCCGSVSDGQIIVSDRITVALAPTNGKQFMDQKLLMRRRTRRDVLAAFTYYIIIMHLLVGTVGTVQQVVIKLHRTMEFVKLITNCYFI